MSIRDPIRSNVKNSLFSLAAAIGLTIVVLIGVLIGFWMTRGSESAGNKAATGSNGLVVGGGLTLGLIVLIISVVAFIFFVIVTIVLLLKNGKEVIDAVTPEKSATKLKEKPAERVRKDSSPPF